MAYKHSIAIAVQPFAGRTLTTEQVVSLVAHANPNVPEGKIRANVSPAYYCSGSAFGAELFARTGQRGLYRVLSTSERTITVSSRGNGSKKPLADTASELLATLEQAKDESEVN